VAVARAVSQAREVISVRREGVMGWFGLVRLVGWVVMCDESWEVGGMCVCVC
jgi:hypothetical protein